MIKILYIFHVSEIGGGSLCLLNMIKCLDTTKFIPIVLLKTKGPLVDEFESRGVSVFIEKSISTIPYNESLFRFRSIKLYWSMISSLNRIRYWVEKTDADIVHINTMMMYPYAIPAFKLGRKVIVHMRENWPQNEHKIQFEIARYVINHFSSKIIAINKTSANQLNIPNKTEIVYDWIDFEDRDGEIDLKESNGVDIKKDKVFLFLGGTQLIKGAYEVVSVFSKDINKNNIKLLLLGADQIKYDNHGFVAFIKKILRSINMPVKGDSLKKILQDEKQIIHIPRTKNVLSLYQQVYCVIAFPTIPHAILPIAESIWNCTPIISADTLEAREYSNDGKAAILIPINNKVALKEAIIYAINNENKIKELAMNGVDYIREKFDAKRNSKILDIIYSRLLMKANTN
jgi:glycosyltransferase involved in cell wall biosynthesis